MLFSIDSIQNVAKEQTKDVIIIFFFFLFVVLLRSQRDAAFHLINHRTQSSKQETHAKLPSAHTNSVDEEIEQPPIDNYISQEDTKAPPLVTIVHVKAVHVLSAIRVRTVLAIRRGIGVNQVSGLSELGNICACVFATRAAGRGVELRHFTGQARHLDRGEHTRVDSTKPPC